MCAQEKQDEIGTEGRGEGGVWGGHSGGKAAEHSEGLLCPDKEITAPSQREARTMKEGNTFFLLGQRCGYVKIREFLPDGLCFLSKSGGVGDP